MSSVIKYNFVVEDSIPSFETKSNEDTNNDELIKLKQKEKLDRETSRKIIDDAKKEANRIIENAEKRANEYVEETYIKAKEIIDNSKSEGYNKGYQEGKKVADELIEEANGIKLKYLEKSKEILKEIEKDVIDLVIYNCENILNMKLDEDKETIISIILKGLDNLNSSDSLIIRVSKDDYNVVELSKDRIIAMAGLVEDIEIKIDTKLKCGGCIIESKKGSVDVSLNSQINEMKIVLNNLLNCE